MLRIGVVVVVVVVVLNSFDTSIMYKSDGDGILLLRN